MTEASHKRPSIWEGTGRMDGKMMRGRGGQRDKEGRGSRADRGRGGERGGGEGWTAPQSSGCRPRRRGRRARPRRPAASATASGGSSASQAGPRLSPRSFPSPLLPPSTVPGAPRRLAPHPQTGVRTEPAADSCRRGEVRVRMSCHPR